MGRARLATACAMTAGLAIAVTVAVWSQRSDQLRVAPTPTLTVRPERHQSARRPLTRTVLARLARVGLPLYCGGDRRREVALTFDDGPGPYTPLALRILRRARVEATFFVVGKEVVRWPWELRRELRAGAVGDHTWTHRLLPALPPSRVQAELASTKELIARLTHRSVIFFRPPFGSRSGVVDAAARRLRLVEVLWSVDSRDSEGATWTRIAANVLGGVRPGSIVLLHENRGQTIRALKFLILPALRRLRLHPVPLTQLLADDPPSPAQVRRGLSGCQASRSAQRGSW